MYTIHKSILNFLPVLLTYISFKYNMPPYYFYIFLIIVSSFFGGLISLYYSKLNCDLNYKSYINEVLTPCLSLLFLMLVSGFTINYFFNTSFLRLILVCITTTIIFFTSVYWIFLSVEEKELTDELIMKIKNKLF